MLQDALAPGALLLLDNVAAFVAQDSAQLLPAGSSSPSTPLPPAAASHPLAHPASSPTGLRGSLGLGSASRGRGASSRGLGRTRGQAVAPYEHQPQQPLLPHVSGCVVAVLRRLAVEQRLCVVATRCTTVTASQVGGLLDQFSSSTAWSMKVKVSTIIFQSTCSMWDADATAVAACPSDDRVGRILAWGPNARLLQGNTHV